MKNLTSQEIYDQIWPSPWPLPIFYLISGLIGLVLGSAILHVVLKYYRKNMHIDMKLGLCLVVLDVLSSIDFIFSSVVNLPVFQLYVHYPAACMAQVAWASTTFIASMNLIGIIALERCLLIVYNIRLKDKHYWYMVSVAYIIPLFNAILCIATDSVEFQNFGVVCHYSAHTWYGITAFLIMMLFSSISFGALIVCYIKIVYFRRTQVHRQQIELGLDPEKVRKEVNTTTIKLVLVLVINIGSNMPYCITQFLGLFVEGIYTPKIAFFFAPFCMLDIVWNSVIFLILHSEIATKMKETYFTN